jgi:hypothetical protein
MENKKYLDKVLGYIVGSTKIDYDKREVIVPFHSLHPLLLLPLSPYLPLSLTFVSYCKNTFGLTKDEIRYIWKEYRNIINDKIENEQ